MADAILVGCLGQRGNDANHKESLDSLNKLCKERKCEPSGIKHLGWLLSRKTDLVYGDRDLDVYGEVKAALLHAERFVSWAYSVFPEMARANPPGVD
jgi:hypothetical protein